MATLAVAKLSLLVPLVVVLMSIFLVAFKVEEVISVDVLYLKFIIPILPAALAPIPEPAPATPD